MADIEVLEGKVKYAEKEVEVKMEIIDGEIVIYIPQRTEPSLVLRSITFKEQ